MNVIEKINNLEKQIVDVVSEELNELYGEIDNYQIAWKQLQDISAKAISNVLKAEIPNAKITLPKSKSVYPDIKLEVNGHYYAIDIKVNESSKNPWFDMARLDTVVEKRLSKYEEEWELVIKYDSKTEKFIKAYFLLFRHVVGFNKDCNGVKYRPYDGKIRPKTWDDFESGKIYWESKGDFKKGIRNSIIHRWKRNIVEYLLSILTRKEKDDFKKLFDD